MLSDLTTGVTPVIEVRRGMPGVMLGGLWTPLPIRGGDGTDDDGEKPPKPADPPAPKPDDKPEDFNKEQALATIAKLRTELKDAKASGKEVESLKAKLKEIEDAQLSESEKIAKDRDDLKSALDAEQKKSRDRVIRSEVRVLASELNFADPADAIAFLDTSGIELDDDGEPKGIKTLLEDLAKAKPYLLKQGNGHAGVPGSPKPNGQTMSRDELVEDKKKKLLAARL